MKPGPLYKGFELMLSEGRVKDAPNLTNYDDFIKFLSTYKYHYRTLNIKDLTKLEYYLYVDSNNNYIKKENIKKY
jgi:hypothetical protein